MGIGGLKENDGGVNSTVIHRKNFCQCHNGPPSTTIIKKLKYIYI
jgi:hypothetical protein